jgi:hypothetical protein
MFRRKIIVELMNNAAPQKAKFESVAQEGDPVDHKTTVKGT